MKPWGRIEPGFRDWEQDYYAAEERERLEAERAEDRRQSGAA